MLSGGVCLACMPPLSNDSRDRVWPDSAPLSVAIYVCGVGSNAPSPEFLRRDATKVHIILTDLWQRRCPVSWTLLVVIIPFEPSPRPLQFYLYKGAALWHEGPRSPYFTFYQACLYVDGAVSSLVFVYAENWMSFQHLARLSSSRSALLKPARHFLLDGPVHCRMRFLRTTSSGRGQLFPMEVSCRPEAYRHAQLTTSVKISQVFLWFQNSRSDHFHCL